MIFINKLIECHFDLGEAQIRVAVEVAEQFIALTGRSKEYTKHDGVINRDVLAKY